MLSGEFRRDDVDHARYLGEEGSKWDPDAEVCFFPALPSSSDVAADKAD